MGDGGDSPPPNQVSPIMRALRAQGPKGPDRAFSRASWGLQKGLTHGSHPVHLLKGWALLGMSALKKSTGPSNDIVK